MFEGKTFFITGSTGFVGSNLVKRLLKENVTIIGSYNNTFPRMHIPQELRFRSGGTERHSALN